MKSAPRPARTQSRTEKPRARCPSTYLKAAAAEPATERIEPNMRAFSGSRNGCAGDPATSGRSSTLGATVSSRHSSPLSRLPDSWQRRADALRKGGAQPPPPPPEGAPRRRSPPPPSRSTTQGGRKLGRGSPLTEPPRQG